MNLVRPWRSVAFLVTTLGCGSGNPEANPTPHSIDMTPVGPLTMRPGDVAPLGIVVRDRHGDALFGHGAITFSSSAPQVATAAEVSPISWTLTAHAQGTAIIQAKLEGAVGQMTVKVTVWPRGDMDGGTFGAAARGSVVMVTTLNGIRRGGGHIVRVDPASGSVQAEYDFSSTYVALSADASHAFFGNVVFDLASEAQTGALVTDVNSCGDITAAVERPQGSAMYLGCSVGVVVASSTGDILGTIPTAAPVNSLALDPTGDHLYASAPSAGRVYEISTATSTLTRELPILGGPQTSVLPGGNELYESMEGEHQIERWDVSGPTEVDSLPIQQALGAGPSGPFDLALSADGTRLLTSAGPYVIELDRPALTVTKTYWVGGVSRRIAVAGGSALVANENGWVDVLPF